MRRTAACLASVAVALVWVPLLGGLGLLCCGYMLVRWEARTVA
jgi:hypothetical protein